MGQLDLFERHREPLVHSPPSSGLTPMSRQTSEAAARAIEPAQGTLRYEVWQFIRSRGEKGATDEEMQNALAMNPSTQRPRRGELLKDGLIRESGLRPTASGRKAVVWVVIEEDGHG